ncbi:hypothetical protein [Phaeobacter sp. NW0010-22]
MIRPSYQGSHAQAAGLLDDTRRLQDAGADVDLRGLWHGAVEGGFTIATVIGTGALALLSLKAADIQFEIAPASKPPAPPQYERAEAGAHITRRPGSSCR